MADAAPTLESGSGRLAIGALATPRLAGLGARLDHQLKPWLSAYALGELGYSTSFERWDWLASAGLRFTW